MFLLTRMASFINIVSWTCGTIIYLLITVCAMYDNSTGPWIMSMKVVRKNCEVKICKYYVLVSCAEFLGYSSWGLTTVESVRGDSCNELFSNTEINMLENDGHDVYLEIILPKISKKLFFCVFMNAENRISGYKWLHQGVDYYLNPRMNELSQTFYKVLSNKYITTQTTSSVKNESKLSKFAHNMKQYSKLHKLLSKENVDMQSITNNVHINNINNSKSDKDRFVEKFGNFGTIFENKYKNLKKNEKWHKDITVDADYDSIRNVDIITNSSVKESKKKNNLYELGDNQLYKINSLKIKKNAKTNHLNKYKKGVSGSHLVNIELNKNFSSSFDVPNNFNRFLLQNNKFSGLGIGLGRYKSKDSRSKKLSYKSEKLLQNDITDKVVVISNHDDNTYYDFKKVLTIIRNQNLIGNSLGNNKLQNEMKNKLLKNSLSKNNLLGDSNVLTHSINELKSNELPEYNQEKSDTVNKSERKVVKYSYEDENLSDEISHVKDGPLLSFESKSINRQVSDTVNVKEFKDQDLIRKSREINLIDYTNVNDESIVPYIEGIRIENSEKDPKVIEGGIPSVLANSGVTLRIFGSGITEHTVIALTHDNHQYGQPCKFLLRGEYMIKRGSLERRTALFEIAVPPSLAGSKIYLCAKNLQTISRTPSNDEGKYIHQGNETYKIFASHNSLLPIWFSLMLILVCLMFSALFSGLNLGLMSLDKTELKIISNTGTEEERQYAKAIMPVRDHGNYLLCSILLGNVAVNSTFTILLDELTSGLFAVIMSTVAIVLFGEISPQAICSRHGLMIGAKTIMVTKSVMALTAPLAFPISKLLDYLLGEEIGSVFNRERLKELVKVTTGANDLNKDEVNIISGALELRKKTVSDVMTKLEDVFMLPICSVLDFETMSEIVKSGFSRIPVYEGDRGNIVTVLFIKDLAFVDPDDNTPLQTLCQYYQNPCNFVFEDLTLDVMFRQFKDGNKGHMAFVHRINNEGEGDPFYETIGLVTLEDVIEEMIQAEIIDETDVFMDNRSKRRRKGPQHKLQDFAAFAERHENQRIHISPQLTLATFQFLSTSVDAFRPDTVSETVLRRLLTQDVIQYIKVKGKTKKDSSTFIFKQGKPVDKFVLVLEGRVEVTVGRESLVFEAGPFTYFGVQALTQNIGVAESPTPSAMGSLQNINMESMLRHTFVPDYSVRAIADLYYLTVKRSLYLAAKRATLMENGVLSKGVTNDQFDTEVDKLLQSVDEDISIYGEQRTPSRQAS